MYNPYFFVPFNHLTIHNNMNKMSFNGHSVVIRLSFGMQIGFTMDDAEAPIPIIKSLNL
jgi:hypothetical protein